MMTINEVQAHIAKVDAKLADLGAETTRMSLAAIAGDAKAEARLVDISGEVSIAKAKRSALAEALAAARRNEADAVDDAEDAAREAHMAAARNHAGNVVALSAQADKLIRDWKAVLASLSDEERAVHSSLMAAGQPIGVAIIGQKDIAGMATDGMMRVVRSLDRFQNADHRGVAERARIAWADLIEGHDDV